MTDDGTAQKTCTKCGLVKDVGEFRKGKRRCKACRYEQERKYRAENPEKWAERKSKYRAENKEARAEYELKNNYGITLDQRGEMHTGQEAACAICGAANRKLAVDHCHASGVVRGLLCGRCNRGLGLFDDNPETTERAAAYLRYASVAQTMRPDAGGIEIANDAPAIAAGGIKAAIWFTNIRAVA